ncbi:HDOD domain-containing protein [Desulfobacter sp.]|uniref:HDOD domain-containing protein n=1 Tax=Desulfobacter sp. TaxID=2294 RepID=UPI003D14E7BD
MTTVQTLVREIKNLKPIPAVIHPLLDALNSPNAGMDEVAKIIQYDPAITAAVLRTANSAFFGLKHPVESIKDAAALLGMDQIINLVLLKSGAEIFNTRPDVHGQSHGAIWKYSVSSALIARQIADELNMPGSAGIFTAALLKDMGKTVLDRFVDNANEKICGLMTDKALSAMAAEKEVIGVDHAELGAMIAKMWKFSPNMVKTIRCHHISDIKTMQDLNIAVVYLADCICMMMGMDIGTDGTDEADGLSGRFHKQVLKRTGFRVDDMTRIISEFPFKIREVESLLKVV